MATCYRHPDRETGVACSSCGRPICPDCMTPTPVGMRCPECSQHTTTVRTTAQVRARGGTAAMPVTMALIAVNVFMYLLEIATGSGGLNGANGSVVTNLALIGEGLKAGPGGVPELIGVAHGEYWRLVTGGFLHASILHIAFNMYLLYILGQLLEPAIGSVRFSVIYVASLFAGSFGALLLEPHAVTVGASGAIFGLMGAAFFEMRNRGMNPMESGIGFLIIINLGLGLFINNISIGGHLGGLVGGALAIMAFHWADRMRQPALGYVGCAVIAIAAAVAGVVVSDMAGLGSPHIG
jgi:membrane associated rhomboid family serine protease